MAIGIRQGAKRWALLLALGASACADDDSGEDPCAPVGEPQLEVFPHQGEGALAEGQPDLPAFNAPQGAPGSQLELRLRGIDLEGMSLMRTRLDIEGGTTPHEAVFLVPQNLDIRCEEDGALGIYTLPILYPEVPDVDELDGLEGDFYLSFEGDTPLEFSWPVRLRVTQY